jgi:hypothetical protein
VEPLTCASFWRLTAMTATQNHDMGLCFGFGRLSSGRNAGQNGRT